jgi:hypothetical protein
MKKPRKSRVATTTVSLLYGILTEEGGQAIYYVVTPHDKKGREIPSSVNCAYNSDYYAYDDILPTAQAL